MNGSAMRWRTPTGTAWSASRWPVYRTRPGGVAEERVLPGMEEQGAEAGKGQDLARSNEPSPDRGAPRQAGGPGWKDKRMAPTSTVGATSGKSIAKSASVLESHHGDTRHARLPFGCSKC